MPQKMYCNDENQECSVYPLCEIVAALQRLLHLSRVHGRILAQVLCVLPFEKLDAILRVRFAPKVAVGRCFLVLWLTQGQRHCNCAWPAVKFDLHDISDVIGCELSAFGAIGLYEK